MSGKNAERVRRSELCTAALLYFDVSEVLFSLLLLNVVPKKQCKIIVVHYVIAFSILKNLQIKKDEGM